MALYALSFLEFNATWINDITGKAIIGEATIKPPVHAEPFTIGITIVASPQQNIIANACYR